MEYLEKLFSNLGGFLIGAVGAVAGLIGAIKAYQTSRDAASREKEELMVKNFQNLYDEQKEQMGRLREDVVALRQEQADERKQWSDERIVFQQQIAQLTESNAKKEQTISDLRNQLNDFKASFDTK